MSAPKTGAALLRQLRGRGEEALTNLAPIVLSVRVAPGYAETGEDFLTSASIEVGPAVNPALAAIADTQQATRRGPATWQVGYGEDTPQGAVAALLRALRPGTATARHSLETTKGPRDLSAEPRRGYVDLDAELRHVPVPAPVRRAHSDASGGRSPYYPAFWERHADARAARHGVVGLRSTAWSLWISFHTTNYLDLPYEVGEEVGVESMNLWRPGKARRRPVLLRPAQAVRLLEWAAGESVPLYSPDDTGFLARLVTQVNQSVAVWPRPGRPSQSIAGIGRDIPEVVRAALGGTGHGTGITRVDSDQVTAVSAAHPTVPVYQHPAVADVTAMQAATAVDSVDLRPYQAEAVARHLATRFGYVNASSPGTGKTIMVLDALRRRAAKIPGYRGLVVAEANVRQQWCAEAQTWFPGATTVQVASRADAERLEQTLADAGPFPVLVVTSYALASDVMATVKDDTPLEPEEELDPADDGQEALDVPVAPADGPAEEPPAVREEPPAVILPDGEPDDLLGLLALLLAQDAEVDQSGIVPHTDGTAQVRLGDVLMGTRWHDLIADEAKTLHATGTVQAKALWALRGNADVAVALTGTPISKSIDDIGALVSWVRADRTMFHGRRLSNEFDIAQDEHLRDFHQAIGPLLFRRDKSEIADEIPQVAPPQVVRLTPNAAEAALAHAARTELKQAYDDLVEWLAVVSAEHNDTEEYRTAKERLANARHAWLGGTTLARMASSDPEALLSAKGAGAALLTSQGLVAAATEQTGTKRAWLVASAIERVTNGERLLVFTDFASVARGLIKDLDEAGLRVGAVVGGGGKARDRDVAAFADGELDVLVCTAAGEKGLNLQTATTLVHYDLPWTPEGIIQRMGRIERIGATADKIHLVFPIMEGTIEERVASIVVARAATMMRALDMARGADASHTDAGRALGGLVAVADLREVTTKDAALLAITRELLAA